jgi:hypothetical protein
LVTRRNPLTGANAVPIRSNQSFIDVVAPPCHDPRSSDHALDSHSPSILNRPGSTSPSLSHVSPTPTPPSQPNRLHPHLLQPNSPPAHPSAQVPPCTTLPLMGRTKCLDPFHRRTDCKSLVRCRA